MSKIVKLGVLHKTEYGLKQRLSQFKIHLYMKRPPNQYYYGADSCTLARILHQDMDEVPFDGRKGLQNCEAIAARFQGRYQRAVIYQRQPGGAWQEITTFFDGGGPPAPVVQLPQPARVVHMRVVHNALQDQILFIPNQQAA